MIYLFDDYSLDPDLRELRRGADLVALEPQVFDLLLYLVRNRERVVSKDDIIAAVWNGRIVSESALTSRLTAVRHAVGDSGEKQRLIRTIPRRGLRFVGEVREESPSGNMGLPDKPSIAVLPFSGPEARPGHVKSVGRVVTPEIAEWLKALGLSEYAECFAESGIDVSVLRHLTDQDLKDLGVLLGHRRGMLVAIAELAGTIPTPPQPSLAELKPQDAAERRQLTVMICDLVDSTALSARCEPEVLRDIFGAYHQRCAEVITKADGFVAKYTGGVLAYFGYPHAHEDDAERAVRAGLALAEAAPKLATAAGSPLQVGVGIATGLVVIGDVIGSGTQERDIVGEAPNVAARLQGIAEPNTVVIGRQTRRLLGDLFEYRDLGAVELRGLPEPMRAYQVIHESALESRFEALHGATLTPLVGREEEIDLLRRQWDRAKRGDGRVVLLSGEPGIGKSRLTAALQERIENEPHTRLRYFCSPHHQDSALHPIIAQLERAAGFEREDTPEGKLDKLAVLTPTSPEDEALLAELLSLPTEGRLPPLKFTPWRKKEKTFEALLRQLEALARQHPVLIVFEDLHWIDPSSRELLDLVVERVPRLPVLLVVTFRPEFQPPWTGQSHVTVLVLNRLDRREGAALVQRVIGAEALAGEVVAEIVERADGVPLFVEELTKVVLEGANTGTVLSRAGGATLNIPATLHASLVARLDRLGWVAKDVAQVGAALGREFSHLLIREIASSSAAALQNALDRLTASGLLLSRGAAPRNSYVFKHALVQDAAYETMLVGRREQLHARIAEVLEQFNTEMMAQPSEILAHHWTRAGASARATEHWTAAAERAQARGANREASKFFENALAELHKLAQTPEILARIVDLHLALFTTLYRAGELHRRRASLEEAERLAIRLNDMIRLGRILAELTYFLGSTGEISAAIDAGERALAIATQTDDLDSRTESGLMLARALCAKGRYDEAIGQIRPVIAMLGEDVTRGKYGIAMNRTVMARVWLTICCAELGDFAESAASSAVALRLMAQVEREGENEDLIWWRIGAGRLAVLQQDFSKAVEILEPAVAACEGEFVIYFSRVVSSLGFAYVGLGEFEKGLALLRQAVSRAQAIGFLWRFGLLLAQLGEALLLAGDTDSALEAGMRALEAARSSGEEASEAWAAWLLGDVEARLHHPEAAARYRKALEISNRLGMTPLRVRCLESMARLV